MKDCSSTFEFEHGIESSVDTLLVSLRGQMVYETLASVELCWEAVRAVFRPSVELDLSRVTFVCSAALGSLLGLRRWLESRGCRLRITAMSPDVRRILTVTRLMPLLMRDDTACETAA